MFSHVKIREEYHRMLRTARTTSFKYMTDEDNVALALHNNVGDYGLGSSRYDPSELYSRASGLSASDAENGEGAKRVDPDQAPVPFAAHVC